PATAAAAKIFPHILTERGARFAASLEDDYRRRYMMFTSYFTNHQKAELYTEEFKAKVWQDDTYDLIASRFLESGSLDRTEQAVYADFSSYLPEDLLAKVDIASMTVALEGRSP